MSATGSFSSLETHLFGLHPHDHPAPAANNTEHLYSGHDSVVLSPHALEALFENGSVALSSLQQTKGRFLENQCFVVTGVNGTSTLAIHKAGYLRRINTTALPFWGIKPRNKEQHFALEVLADDTIPAVTLVGQAGTGKTLFALAAGLQKVLEDGRYDHVLVTRPVIPVGRHDLGFLPGSKENKMLPWIQPILDNLSRLSKGQTRTTWDYLKSSKALEIESIGYLRGRSIARTWMIVDEAQNLSPLEVKTVLSRASEGTKVILTGDIDQIDAVTLNADTNGLTHVVNRLKGEPLFAHVRFSKTVRSPLAALAARLL